MTCARKRGRKSYQSWYFWHHLTRKFS